MRDYLGSDAPGDSRESGWVVYLQPPEEVLRDPGGRFVSAW